MADVLTSMTDGAPRARRIHQWAALLVLCLGFFVLLLDASILTVAVPTMLSSLGATLDQILWVMNAYLIALAVLLITGARIGDILGQRNLFVAGLSVFTGASALCGISSDANQLIAARVLQGVGGAMMSPQTLVIVSAIFPAERRGAALGILSGVTGLAAVLGPTVGGLLVTYLNWRWIFYVNVPIGIAGISGAFAFVPDLRPGRRHRLDLVGVALATLGLFAIVFGLIEGQRYEWAAIAASAVTIPEVIAAGVAAIAIFVVWESRQTEPLLPLILFRNRNYSVMVWLNVVFFFSVFSFAVTMNIFMQSVLGFSAIQAGLTQVPMAVVMSSVAPFAGRLTDRLGGRYILMTGTLLAAAGMGGADALASLGSSSYTFVLPFAVTGVGLGLIIAPSLTEAMRDVAPPMFGAASGLLNTCRQLGGAVGVAVVGAVLSNRLASSLHDQAVLASTQLPSGLRGRFIAGFDQATKAGLEVGTGQAGGAGLMAGIPPENVQHVEALVHQVFSNSFVNALHPAAAIPAAAFLFGAVSCLLIVRRRARPAAVPGALVHAIVVKASPQKVLER